MLIDALKNGNPEVFSEIYKKYWEKLYYMAYKRLGSHDEAEDIIHDLFVDLWKNREKLNIQKSFDAYIFTALKFKIFRHIDSKAVRKKYLQNAFAKELPIDYSIEDSLLFDELYEKIEENIEKLPKKCRVVFKLSRYKNYSVNEISKKLNISPNTAQNHINKALKKLRYGLANIITSVIILLSL